jgi:ABC-type nitrate/sulfonate/bicarbonate transport system permease component
MIGLFIGGFLGFVLGIAVGWTKWAKLEQGK